MARHFNTSEATLLGMLFFNTFEGNCKTKVNLANGSGILNISKGDTTLCMLLFRSLNSRAF